MTQIPSPVPTQTAWLPPHHEDEIVYSDHVPQGPSVLEAAQDAANSGRPEERVGNQGGRRHALAPLLPLCTMKTCHLSLMPPKMVKGRRADTMPDKTTTTTGQGSQTRAAGAACTSHRPLHPVLGRRHCSVLSSPVVDTGIASALQMESELRSRGTLQGHHGGPRHDPPKPQTLGTSGLRGHLE